MQVVSAGPGPDLLAGRWTPAAGSASRAPALREWSVPYLLLGVFLGGIWFADRGWDGDRGDRERDGGPGLIALLVLFAAIALLFTTRYPRGIFDLVMGLNRWVFRIVGYAALMTDVYPPFRLDQGGPEAGASPSKGGVAGARSDSELAGAPFPLELVGRFEERLEARGRRSSRSHAAWSLWVMGTRARALLRLRRGRPSSE